MLRSSDPSLWSGAEERQMPIQLMLSAGDGWSLSIVPGARNIHLHIFPANLFNFQFSKNKHFFGIITTKQWFE